MQTYDFNDLLDHYDILKNLIKKSYPETCTCSILTYPVESPYSPLAIVSVETNAWTMNAYISAFGFIMVGDPKLNPIVELWLETLTTSEQRNTVRNNMLCHEIIDFSIKKMNNDINIKSDLKTE